MNAENLKDLSKIRYERAMELLKEADELLSIGAYKSANNRAYYAAEKGIKALLAIAGTDSETHSGTLKLFNLHYIKAHCDYFDHDDYVTFQKMERIRSLSDYDDFYIASKSECEEQVQKATDLVDKVRSFFEAEKIM